MWLAPVKRLILSKQHFETFARTARLVLFRMKIDAGIPKILGSVWVVFRYNLVDVSTPFGIVRGIEFPERIRKRRVARLFFVGHRGRYFRHGYIAARDNLIALTAVTGWHAVGTDMGFDLFDASTQNVRVQSFLCLLCLVGT